MANTKTKKDNVEIKAEITETKQEIKEKPKKIELDMKEMVLCRSVVHGILTYKSPKTGFQVVWNDYGATEWISVEELITMKASKPVFLTNPWIIIEDNDDVIQYLGLKHIYEALVDVTDLENFFRLPLHEIESKLKKLPRGFKETVAQRARQMIEDEILYDTRIIKILEKELNTNLQILLEE